MRQTDDYDDDDDYGFGRDVDGPLMSSDKWAIYTLPLAFFGLALFFNALIPIGPRNEEPASWIPFFLILALGGSWDWKANDRYDDER